MFPLECPPPEVVTPLLIEAPSVAATIGAPEEAADGPVVAAAERDPVEGRSDASAAVGVDEENAADDKEANARQSAEPPESNGLVAMEA